jgi:hypothetical protein
MFNPGRGFVQTGLSGTQGKVNCRNMESLPLSAISRKGEYLLLLLMEVSGKGMKDYHSAWKGEIRLWEDRVFWWHADFLSSAQGSIVLEDVPPDVEVRRQAITYSGIEGSFAQYFIDVPPHYLNKTRTKSLMPRKNNWVVSIREPPQSLEIVSHRWSKAKKRVIGDRRYHGVK